VFLFNKIFNYTQLKKYRRFTLARINDKQDCYLLEVGYNGCDITDIKTEILVPASEARWLAEVIYSGLEAQDYSGRFVNIVGHTKNNYASLNQSTRHIPIDEIQLPEPRRLTESAL